MTDQSVSVIVRHIIGNNDTLQTQSNHGDQDLRLNGKVSILEKKIFDFENTNYGKSLVDFQTFY